MICDITNTLRMPENYFLAKVCYVKQIHQPLQTYINREEDSIKF